MIDDFDKIVADLEKDEAFFEVLNKKPINFDDAKEYNIDLNALDNCVTVEKEIDENISDITWQNLDVNIGEILNSFIATSERPVFLIRDDKIVYINQAALSLFGFNKDIVGCNFFSLIVKDDRELLSKNIGEMITKSKSVKVRVRNASGKITPANFSAIYLPESDHFSFILYEEYKKQKNTFHYSNMYDEITGLPNFFLFEDRVQVAINEKLFNKEIGKDDSLIAIVLVNIDNMELFKKIHIEDEIKRKISSALIFNLPKTTTIGMGLKYTFWLMLKTKNKNELDEQITCISKVLNKGVSDNFIRHSLLFSMGVSLFPKNSTNPKKLMEQAIKALEKNQLTRKSFFEFFCEELI